MSILNSEVAFAFFNILQMAFYKFAHFFVGDIMNFPGNKFVPQFFYMRRSVIYQIFF